MITPNPDFKILQSHAEEEKLLQSKIRDSERQESRLGRALYLSTERLSFDENDVSLHPLIERARQTLSDDDVFFVPPTGLTAVTFDYTVPAPTDAMAEFDDMGFGFPLSAQDVALISTLEQRHEGRLFSIDVRSPNHPILVLIPNALSSLVAEVVQQKQNRQRWQANLMAVQQDTLSIYQKNIDRFLFLGPHRISLGDPAELFRDLASLFQTDYAQNRPAFFSHLLGKMRGGFSLPMSSFSRRCCRVFLSLVRGEPFHPASMDKALIDKAIPVVTPLLPLEVLPPFFPRTSAPDRISRVIPKTKHLRVTLTNGDVQRWPLPSSSALVTATPSQREYFQIHGGRQIVWPELNTTLSLQAPEVTPVVMAPN